MRLPQRQVSRMWVKVGSVSARTMVQKSAMTTRAQRAQHKSRIGSSPDLATLQKSPAGPGVPGEGDHDPIQGRVG
jgi:hypothetical protein